LGERDDAVRDPVCDYTGSVESIDHLARHPPELLIEGLDHVHGVAWGGREKGIEGEREGGREGGREGRTWIDLGPNLVEFLRIAPLLPLVLPFASLSHSD
jgi:hypothetical protein